MKMSNRTPVLTKKDLRRCALRSWINVNLFNYETQLGGAVVFAEAKALRKIYPDDDDYQKAMLNQFKYYNTMPYFHERRFHKEPGLAAAGTADYKDIFVSCVFRLLRAAVHGKPFRLR